MEEQKQESVTVRLEPELGKEAFALGMAQGYRAGIQDVLWMLGALLMTAALFRAFDRRG